MTPREIIAKAWAITLAEPKMRRWGVISSFFETLRSVEIVAYQVYYLYWYWQGETVGWFDVELLLFRELPRWLFMVLTALLVLLILLELFIPTLCSGAIIGLGAKSYRKEEVKGGLILGLSNFFPILELHGLFILSNLTAVVTVISLVIRYAGDDAMRAIGIGVILFLSILAIVLHFFASFAEEGVVIRKLGVFGAVGRSFKLFLSHLTHIVFILILLFVISLRILINAVVVFLLPGIAIGLGLLLTLVLPHWLSYTIAGMIGFILLCVVSYFLAYLHVFRQTVWTVTYLILSDQKDLDVIGDAEQI